MRSFLERKKNIAKCVHFANTIPVSLEAKARTFVSDSFSTRLPVWYSPPEPVPNDGVSASINVVLNVNQQLFRLAAVSRKKPLLSILKCLELGLNEPNRFINGCLDVAGLSVEDGDQAVSGTIGLSVSASHAPNSTTQQMKTHDLFLERVHIVDPVSKMSVRYITPPKSGLSTYADVTVLVHLWISFMSGSSRISAERRMSPQLYSFVASDTPTALLPRR
jgi:hypothetical protein